MLFVPRQVVLAASSQPRAAASSAMAKEESKKEKKKAKAKVANGAAAAAAAPVPGARAAVVASVAAFLESAGLSRTLVALQSEAGLEAGAWGSSQVNLEELVARFLESSNSTRAAAILGSDEQDKENDDIAGEVGKEKKRSGTEAGEPESKAIEPLAEEKPTENMDGEAKEKKQKKKKDKGDPSAANAASEGTTEIVKNADQKDDEAKEKKQKKKKDKGDPSAAGAGSGETTETVKEDDHKLDGKKKKKNKKQGKDDDVEARLEKAELAILNKFEAAEKLNGREVEPKGQNDSADDCSGAVERKKKKKEKSSAGTSEKTDAGSAPAEADGAKGKNGAVETVKDDNEKKAKKKRKKSNPEETVQVEGKEAAGKDSVPKQDDANKSVMEIEEGNQGKSSNENAVAGKKRKLEEVEGSIPPVTGKEDCTANESLSNGFAEDKKEESNTKPSKRQKHSSEPKTVTPFQRIKVDDVRFADDRLQDNSYWAKGGADTGYGAKAQEILGQVKGRGFRHEKTKKKRGTYRGGQIDLQTHSIKFENSDDE
ncbi:uncharacterized protein [Zea mays]|uniref:SRP40 carboxy-terminal domain protein n=2 Tax=Zea mays TaxID=4577 RepID=A0A096ST13_MAIZE|nr:uncharacterized protein LOC100382414 [Zea mays]XP_008673131.1 uncharacterized protein LOC100382414 isoform X1 [Zea mays]ONM33125.1 SRP40 carboxy-terminal domain protein [Zea mays]ONM33126.1 SRP40 carboxy-terminal domain protein [Zea mays]ONM33128.1 SRP40 carboxy-terminal domain protein [Zea mays]|eukprot:NP_001168628.2 uncharacterized protein LOC100382414 [Zea mays]